MFSQTLGTALGDWMADDTGLGYGGGAVVFGAALAVVAGLYLYTTVSRAVLFWAAFILTRPLGATVGDFLDKPVAHGGLALGRFEASAVLAGLILACIWFIPQRAVRDIPASSNGRPDKNARGKQVLLDSIIAPVAAWIVGMISAAGYAGIAGLMAIESACIPLPSEVIMPFAGYLASTGRFSLVLAATAGAVGCNIGSTLAYVAGARGGRGLVERWGHYILLKPGDLDRADRFFRRFGGPAVLAARMLPVIRTFIALPAGIARMPMVPFQLYTFIGSWPWCYALAYVGYLLGEHWEADPRLRTLMYRFDFAIVGLLVLGAAWFVWRHFRHGRQNGARS